MTDARTMTTRPLSPSHFPMRNIVLHEVCDQIYSLHSLVHMRWMEIYSLCQGNTDKMTAWFNEHGWGLEES